MSTRVTGTCATVLAGSREQGKDAIGILRTTSIKGDRILEKHQKRDWYTESKF
ncbi:hypothetical protein HCG51_18595 [Tolypothrix sp. PCC 7910]|uniref:hypothetical protein n=1 Tax=Tolypothrix sp. PCC 7910 TaxID=2099387 RepID=UPI0014279CEC|nr:hypothetical protein [Tolypothrix sp. PCC 7910]QIR35279.1 hypothetical protein HCG51_18595 [Tolypothrix sp. PCC 7910]